MKHDPLRRDDLCRELYRAVEQYDGSVAQTERLRALVDEVLPYEPRSEAIVEAMARINYWAPLPDVLAVEARLLRNSQRLPRLDGLGDLLARAFAGLPPPRELLTQAILRAAEVSPTAISALVLAGQCVASAPSFTQQLDQVASEFLDLQRGKPALTALELLAKISLGLRCVEPCGTAAPWLETTSPTYQGSALVNQILDWSLRSVVAQVVATGVVGTEVRLPALQDADSKRVAIAELKRLSQALSDRSAPAKVRASALVCAWVRLLFWIDASSTILAAAMEGLFRALSAFDQDCALEALLALLVRVRPCLGAASGTVLMRAEDGRYTLLRRDGNRLLEESGTAQALLGSIPKNAGAARELLRSVSEPDSEVTGQEQAASEVLKRARPDGPTTWQRDKVCGLFSVFLSHDRCLGDNEVCASVCLTARPECSVTFLAPTLSLIALKRRGPIVYEQSQERSGVETTAIDLTTGARCRVNPPARQQVVLLSEAFGGVVDHLSEAPLGGRDALPPFEFGGPAAKAER